MSPGHRSTVAGRLHAARANGALSVVAGLASALALAGAAVYTVEGATCGDGGQYVRHASHVELVGGCVTGTDLPHKPAPNTESGHQNPGTFAGHTFYRP